jgi:putative GTP pyrophosphokinase
MILVKNNAYEINESMIPPQMCVTIDDAKEMALKLTDMRMMYQSAIMEVSTKFEVLDNEYSVKKAYNPIHHMVSRIKSLNSIIDKIERKGLPMEFESISKLTDIAGIRVVCNYIDDVYNVAESLLRQDDIRLIRTTDYIKNPKPSGYRSLHLIVEVPIFLLNQKHFVKVEIQLRTIAMDFWASLEHTLQYKKNLSKFETNLIAKELKDCAEKSAALDIQMENLKNKILQETNFTKSLPSPNS